jgi:outer membrane protein assembly factor BamD (BamD/ComL family)
MGLKIAIVFSILMLIVFGISLNSNFVYKELETWIRKHPNSNNVELMFFTAKWCDLTGGSLVAEKIYKEIYQKYPEHINDACKALYDLAIIASDNGQPRVALSSLQNMIDQFPTEKKWIWKARLLKSKILIVR